MKKLLTSLFFSGFVFILFAQTAMETDSAFIRNNYTKHETYITMRDGIRLFTAIYSPKNTSKKYPILLKRTPYTLEPYGENEFVKTFQNRELGRQGNIFVFQDVRGRWMSESEFVDVRPIVANRKSNKDIDESTDTYDTAEWLTKNVEGNNGRIGVYGISYPGFYATNALVEFAPLSKSRVATSTGDGLVYWRRFSPRRRADGDGRVEFTAILVARTQSRFCQKTFKRNPSPIPTIMIFT